MANDGIAADVALLRSAPRLNPTVSPGTPSAAEEKRKTIEWKQ